VWIFGDPGGGIWVAVIAIAVIVCSPIVVSLSMRLHDRHRERATRQGGRG
jgi:hypothetical protein